MTSAHVKFDSIGSGSTNGVHPHSNMSYSPRTWASNSCELSITSTTREMPICSMNPIMNSRIAEEACPSERST